MSASLLLDESPVLLQRSLVRRLGIAEAAIVQQLHYWAQRSANVHEGHVWVYKTYADWSDEIGISAKAARGALGKLREAGVVIGTQSPLDARDKTLWWRIDYAVLNGEPERGSPSAPQGSPSARAGISRAGVLGSTETTSESEGPTDPCRAVLDGDTTPQSLFAYWQRTTGHTTAKPSRDRLAKVKARLAEGYTPEQIRAAIDGAAAQPFVSDTGRVFDDLELICRNGSKLEDFIARATYTPQRPSSSPVKALNANGNLDRFNDSPW